MSITPRALEALSINGQLVISASDAAPRTGWTRNYIGMLCREGEIAGVRLAAGWFVEEASLEQFLKNRAEYKRSRREALREVRLMEYRLNQSDAETLATNSRASIAKTAASTLLALTIFPFGAFASTLPIQLLPTRDVTSPISRIQNIHERAIRTSPRSLSAWYHDAAHDA